MKHHFRLNSIHLGKALGHLETFKDSICNFLSIIYWKPEAISIRKSNYFHFCHNVVFLKYFGICELLTVYMRVFEPRVGFWPTKLD